MMISTPSAPGGAAAAESTLPGAAVGGAAIAPVAGIPMGTVEGPANAGGLPPLFAQLLDFASLPLPAGTAGTAEAPVAADGAVETEAVAEEAPVEVPLAAMMPMMHFAVLPPAPQQVAATGTAQADAGKAAMRGATLLAGTADSARQAAADAITAAANATTTATPLLARLFQGTLPARAEPAAPKAGGDVRPGVAPVANAAAGAAAAALPAVAMTQDGAAASGQEGQSGQSQADSPVAFRGVMAASAPVAGATAPTDTVKLAGTPDQWQQPLRAALGDRLQVTLQKGNDQAVIRLEPPNLGSIEISIRQTAGALHVSMSATNSEVVRQLNAVGDSMRQDLSQRQLGDVAVTVSQSSRSLADSEGRGRQPDRDQEQRGPGRALNDGDDTNPTFAMLRE